MGRAWRGGVPRCPPRRRGSPARSSGAPPVRARSRAAGFRRRLWSEAYPQTPVPEYFPGAGGAGGGVECMGEGASRRSPKY